MAWCDFAIFSIWPSARVLYVCFGVYAAATKRVFRPVAAVGRMASALGTIDYVPAMDDLRDSIPRRFLGQCGGRSRGNSGIRFRKTLGVGVLYGDRPAWALLSIILMEVGHWMQAKGRLVRLFLSKPVVLRWAVYYAVTIMTLYKYTQGYQEFIYFRF